MENLNIVIAKSIFSHFENVSLLQIGTCSKSDNIVKQFIGSGFKEENIIRTNNILPVRLHRDFRKIIREADIIIFSGTIISNFIINNDFLSIVKKRKKCHMLIFNVSYNTEIEVLLSKLKDLFYYRDLDLG